MGPRKECAAQEVCPPVLTALLPPLRYPSLNQPHTASHTESAAGTNKKGGLRSAKKVHGLFKDAPHNMRLISLARSNGLDTSARSSLCGLTRPVLNLAANHIDACPDPHVRRLHPKKRTDPHANHVGRLTDQSTCYTPIHMGKQQEPHMMTDTWGICSMQSRAQHCQPERGSTHRRAARSLLANHAPTPRPLEPRKRKHAVLQ